MKRISKLFLFANLFLLVGCNSRKSSNKKVITFDEFKEKAQLINMDPCYSTAHLALNAVVSGTLVRKTYVYAESLYSDNGSGFQVTSSVGDAQILAAAGTYLDLRLTNIQTESALVNGATSINSVVGGESVKVDFNISPKYYAEPSEYKSVINMTAKTRYQGIDFVIKYVFTNIWNEYGYLTNSKLSTKTNYSVDGEKGYLDCQITIKISYI